MHTRRSWRTPRRARSCSWHNNLTRMARSTWARCGSSTSTPTTAGASTPPRLLPAMRPSWSRRGSSAGRSSWRMSRLPTVIWSSCCSADVKRRIARRERSMMRMSVLYPATEGATFDHDYYRTNHVPLCSETWKPARVEVDRGVDRHHVAAVHFLFESADTLQAALGGPGTASITADVANYTTIVPVLQVSETTSVDPAECSPRFGASEPAPGAQPGIDPGGRASLFEGPEPFGRLLAGKAECHANAVVEPVVLVEAALDVGPRPGAVRQLDSSTEVASAKSCPCGTTRLTGPSRRLRRPRAPFPCTSGPGCGPVRSGAPVCAHSECPRCRGTTGNTKGRSFTHDGDVGEHGDDQPAALAEPVDCADHGLAGLPQGVERRVVHGQEGGQIAHPSSLAPPRSPPGANTSPVPVMSRPARSGSASVWLTA